MLGLQPVENTSPEISTAVTSQADFEDLLWFALQVQSTRERYVASVLLNKGYETYLPEFRVKRRYRGTEVEALVALFPGYLFVKMDAKHRLPVLTTPAVLSIVGGCNGHAPTPVDPLELAAVRAMVSSGLEVSHVPHLRAGQRVRIANGPLCGTGAVGTLVKWRGKDRLVVSLTILNRFIAVEVDRGSVLPVF